MKVGVSEYLSIPSNKAICRTEFCGSKKDLMNKFLKNIPKGFWVITSVYLLVVCIMLPFRQMAYMDDFAYYLTVKNFLSSGILKISEWSTTSLIFQTYWGALFAKVFGMSFKSLHFSNVFLFYFALVSFYLTLKELGQSEFSSSVFSLTLLGFPNLFRLLYSFTSDIFYLSLLLISIYFSVKLIKTSKNIYAFWASIFAGLAFLNRQFGIAIFLALFIAILFKSFYERKFRIKQLSTIFIIGLIFVLSYLFWLSKNDRLTNAQYLYVVQNFVYLKLYIIPPAYAVYRVSNDIYDEVVTRVGRNVNMLLVISFPLLLFYIHRVRNFTKTINRRNSYAFALGISLLVFLFYMVYKRFPHPDFKGFMVFDAPRILGSLYVNFVLIWKKMFNIIVIVGIIPWSVIIGKSILLLINKLLTRRKNASYIIFIVFVFIFSLLPTTIVLEGYVKYHAEILQYMFMIYLIWGMVILVAYFIYFYQIKRNVSNQFSSSVSIFIVCLGFISMTLTVFNFFAWEEYLIPFIPIVILWLANYFMDSKMNKLLVVVILSSMIIFTLSNVKTDYDQNGIRWEAAEAIINRGLVKPNEVGIINWAWVPYFYYEDSFAKRLKEVGGDKKLITQIHTWWNDDAYNYKVEKLSFVGGNCSDIVLEKNERELEQIEAKSVFATYRYCVVYKM